MSSGTLAKLVMMANQIARNLALEGDPVAATADHIAAFWSPRMKDQIIAHGPGGLDPVAQAAIARLAGGDAPPPQSRATDSYARGSDAG